MGFRITGLSPEPFQPLFGLPDHELRAKGIQRLTVEDCPGYPDRISLRDVPAGETVLLLNHVSQPAATPYRASHAIFVWERADGRRCEAVDEIPEALRRRLLSLRGFSAEGMLVEADVTEGRDAERLIERLFRDERVAAIHAHHARQGCYAALIERD